MRFDDPAHRASPPEGEYEWRRIFAAMIRNAVTEAVFGCRHAGGTEWAKRAETRQRSKDEVLEWFASRRFRELCALHNCDPEVVRLQPLKTIEANRANPQRYINWEGTT